MGTRKEFQNPQRYATGFPTLVMVKNGQATRLQSGFFRADAMKEKLAVVLVQ